MLAVLTYVTYVCTVSVVELAVHSTVGLKAVESSAVEKYCTRRLVLYDGASQVCPRRCTVLRHC